MSTAATSRVVAVLDGTTPGAERRARALGGFLRDGLRLAGDTAVAAADAVTLAFYADDADRDRLVALAPTGDVRLIRTPAFRPDLMAAALTAFEAGGGAELFVFPGGPLGVELAARLAARAGGGVLTDVLERRRRSRRPALPARRLLQPPHRPVPSCAGRPGASRSTRTGTTPASSRPPSTSYARRSSWRPTARPTPPLRRRRAARAAGHRRPGGGEVPRRRRPRRRQPRRRGARRRRRRPHGRRLRRHAPGRHERLGAAGPPDRRLRRPLGPRRLRRRGGARARRRSSGASSAPASSPPSTRTSTRPIAGEADAVVIDDGVAVVEALADIVARERP